MSAAIPSQCLNTIENMRSPCPMFDSHHPMKPSLLVLAAALALPACKKDAPEASLPAATQVGANTAGCLIDGKPFIATSYGGGILSKPIPALGGGFFEDSLYYLRMNGKCNGQEVMLTLYFHSQKEGRYFFDQNTMYYPVNLYALNHATYSIRGSKSEVYVTDAKHTGQVMLNHAIVANGSGISAGTFEFTAANQVDSRKTVIITNGRFDRKQ